MFFSSHGATDAMCPPPHLALKPNSPQSPLPPSQFGTRRNTTIPTQVVSHTVEMAASTRRTLNQRWYGEVAQRGRPTQIQQSTRQIGAVRPVTVVWCDLGVFDFQAVGGRAGGGAVKQTRNPETFQAAFKPTCAQDSHNPVREPLTPIMK